VGSDDLGGVPIQPTPATCWTPASGAASGHRLVIDQKKQPKTGGYLFFEFNGNGPEFA
jgi:hypothetical protein